MAESVAADEALLVLLSGGASALMAVPADGITLDDKRRATERLLKAGADIHALNCVRKHLSALKGGWLAARAPALSRTLAVSDVVGDDLSAIASGPTVADSTTFADALSVLEKYGGVDAYPAAVGARLTSGARGDIPETPKANDPRLARASASVIGNRRDAMNGAGREAAARGYTVICVDEAVVGEARAAADAWLRAIIGGVDQPPRIRRFGETGSSGPTCIVSSGETTVHVVGRGKGGRNQEFALALAEPLANLGAPAVAASAGTDGIDGPTDAAGAIVDSTTLERARSACLRPPARYLDDNDAYAFFHALGDLILTGPTDTNVGDLQVLLFS